MATTQQGPAGLPYTKASGLTDANTMRVVLASDSPGTGAGGVPFDANITQIKGTAISTGNGTTDAGTQRVTIATDSPITIDADTINLNTDTLEALGAAGNASTAAINTKTPAIGQTTKASSSPVALATDPDIRPASGNITAADVGSTTTAGFNSVSIVTGSATANSTQTVAVNGQSCFRSQITGTWVGTLVHELSVDGGTTWVSTGPLGSGTAFRVGNITGNGAFFGDCAGATHVRVRCTAYTSGTAVIQFTTSTSSGLVKIDSPTSLADNSTGTQHTIKAASTGAAAATDAALVVNLREGLPAGTAAIGTVTVTKSQKAASSALTNVTGATGNTNILASNANRLKWTFYNSCSTNAYLKFGTTASTTSFTVLVTPQGYYEDDCWTGNIDAVWDTGVSGDSRVTSLTA